MVKQHSLQDTLVLSWESLLQRAQQRRMHDIHSLVAPAQAMQPEAIMKMLSPEVSTTHALAPCSVPLCSAALYT